MKKGDKVRVIDNPNVNDESTSTTWKRRGQTGILDSNEEWTSGVYRVYFDKDGGYDQIYADALELIEDKFVIPKQWHINVTTKEQAKVVGRWFDQSEFVTPYIPDYYERSGALVIYGGVSPGDVYGNRVGTEITFEQFEKYILKQNNMKKEIIGYLSPTSIGLNSKGTLYTAYRGNAGLYIPELTKDETHRAYYSVPKEIVETSWEPVYKEDQTKTLVLGTGRIKVVIGNGVVVVDGENVIVYKDLLNVYRIMTDNNTKITGSGTSYTVSFPKGVRIGCSDFEISEIEQIINIYNELYK